MFPSNIEIHRSHLRYGISQVDRILIELQTLTILNIIPWWQFGSTKMCSKVSKHFNVIPISLLCNVVCVLCVCRSLPFQYFILILIFLYYFHSTNIQASFFSLSMCNAISRVPILKPLSRVYSDKRNVRYIFERMLSSTVYHNVAHRLCK